MWWALCFVAIFGTSLGLIILNMKWPIVVFYLSIMLTVFMFARKWVYVSTAFCALLMVLVYILISTFVFRLAASSPADSAAPVELKSTVHKAPAAPVEPKSTTQGRRSSDQAFSKHPFERITKLFSTAFSEAPFLARAAIFRMSFSYPYYYHVFTSEGFLCGGLWDQARIGPKCRPSKLIYSRIYGADAFEGRGTAGASVHISAYSLGGWPLAIFSLFATALVLAVFSCLPLDGNATVAALRTTGAIAGYHLSQIPGEGILFYDHGLLWLVLLIAAYASGDALVRLLGGTRRGELRA
jgi:hypothetical protein